jgi:glyoxalase family protein
MARKLVKSHGVHPTRAEVGSPVISVSVLFSASLAACCFEIATDLPGFTIDEPLANLGKI